MSDSDINKTAIIDPEDPNLISEKLSAKKKYPGMT